MIVKCLLVAFAAVFVTLARVEAEKQQNVCQLVLDCIQDAQKAKEKCDTKPSNGTVKANKSHKDGECNLQEQQKQIKAKTDEQKKMYAECLKSRMSQSFDIIQLKKEKKQEQCENAIINNRNSSATGGNTVENDSSRLVRQASDSDDDGSSNGNDGNNGKGKGSGRKGGKGRGKGHGNNPAKECQRAVKQKFKQCKALGECCSETTICHLQFELSPLHDDIRKLQLEVATKKHDCLKAKVGQTSNSVKNNTPTKVLHDDPVSSKNGQSMQDSDEDDTKFDPKNDLDKFYPNSDEDDI